MSSPVKEILKPVDYSAEIAKAKQENNRIGVLAMGLWFSASLGVVICGAAALVGPILIPFTLGVVGLHLAQRSEYSLKSAFQLTRRQDYINKMATIYNNYMAALRDQLEELKQTQKQFGQATDPDERAILQRLVKVKSEGFGYRAHALKKIRQAYCRETATPTFSLREPDLTDLKEGFFASARASLSLQHSRLLLLDRRR